MSEENKAVARRAFEEHFNTGNFDLAQEIFAADYVNHDPSLPRSGSGPEAANQAVRLYCEAFPDAQITVEDQVAEGDKVATRWSARGTHQGELLGVGPTGNQSADHGHQHKPHRGRQDSGRLDQLRCVRHDAADRRHPRIRRAGRKLATYRAEALGTGLLLLPLFTGVPSTTSLERCWALESRWISR